MILLKRAPIGIFLEDHRQCNDIEGFGIDLPDLSGDRVGDSSDLVFRSGANEKRDREKGVDRSDAGSNTEVAMDEARI